MCKIFIELHPGVFLSLPRPLRKTAAFLASWAFGTAWPRGLTPLGQRRPRARGLRGAGAHCASSTEAPALRVIYGLHARRPRVFQVELAL